MPPVEQVLLLLNVMLLLLEVADVVELVHAKEFEGGDLSNLILGLYVLCTVVVVVVDNGGEISSNLCKSVASSKLNLLQSPFPLTVLTCGGAGEWAGVGQGIISGDAGPEGNRVVLGQTPSAAGVYCC